MANGTGGQAKQAQTAGEVVYDAITQWMDCTDEMLARHQTVENYILHRLGEAGFSIERREVHLAAVVENEGLKQKVERLKQESKFDREGLDRWYDWQDRAMTVLREMGVYDEFDDRLGSENYAHCRHMVSADELADILSHHSGLTDWREKAEAVLADIRAEDGAS